MIPRLYNVSTIASGYNHNGLGFFTTCSKCEVTEERNGAYTLSMKISKNDALAKRVGVNKILKVKANHVDPPQLFEIVQVSSDKDSIQIEANHIKYLACQNSFGGDAQAWGTTITGTPQNIFDTITKKDSGYFTLTNYFNFMSDITTSATIDLTNFGNVKFGQFLAGDTGSMLDTFGGEFAYDNFTIKLLSKRGATTKKRIFYGYNLSDYSQEITNDNGYTHIMGYAMVQNVNNSKGITETLPITCAPIKTRNYTGFQKIKIVNVTQEVNAKYGEFTVNNGSGLHIRDAINAVYAMTKAYYAKTGKNAEAEVSLTIDYDSQLDELQNCGLCDNVLVILPDGIEITSKITKTVYDSLNERYIKMEIGDKKMSIDNFFAKRRR